MTFEELEQVCKEAARDLAARQPRPLPATVVVPLPDATHIITLPDFPDDDPTRFDLLQRLAEDRIRPVNAPCYGFVAEADARGLDVVVVVFGARGHHPRISAAPLGDGGTGEFAETETLEPAAMPFLAPLQHAVDASGPPPP